MSSSKEFQEKFSTSFGELKCDPSWPFTLVGFSIAQIVLNHLQGFGSLILDSTLGGPSFLLVGGMSFLAREPKSSLIEARLPISQVGRFIYLLRSCTSNSRRATFSICSTKAKFAYIIITWDELLCMGTKKHHH